MNKRENTPVTLRVLWTDVMMARKTFGNKNIIINPQSINTLHTVARFSLIHSFFYFSIVILVVNGVDSFYDLPSRLSCSSEFKAPQCVWSRRNCTIENARRFSTAIFFKSGKLQKERKGGEGRGQGRATAVLNCPIN